MPISREQAQQAKAQAQAKPYTLLRGLKPSLVASDIVRNLIFNHVPRAQSTKLALPRGGWTQATPTLGT
jgi:hypothetical protein